jgi:thiamine biosynthesis lipoprotein
METFSFRAMNTEIVLAAGGKAGRMAAGFERAQAYIRAGEARFSRFLEDSELSRLNRSAGGWFTASADLFALVAMAEQYFHQTRGLFDPSILTDLRRAGYDRSMDLIREQGASPLLESMLESERPSFGEIELDAARQQILLPPGMALDLGGIAKGWIAEQAATLLSGFAPACAVNAGGDMFLIGKPEDRERWAVALEDPLDPQAVLTTLQVDSGAVATSAVTKRTWKQGSLQRHHLIDPRTGEPAITDWLSVTVMARHAAEAEVYAKALLIAGPRQCESIVPQSKSQLSYLAVDGGKKIWGNQKSLEYAYVS